MALFSKEVLSLGSTAVNLLPGAPSVSAAGTAFRETREPMLTQRLALLLALLLTAWSALRPPSELFQSVQRQFSPSQYNWDTLEVFLLVEL